MWSIDVVVFGAVMFLTSALGIWKGKLKKPQKITSGELLVGSNVSTFSVALSVCSSFLSAVSLLGFPAEVYYRGTMILWFLPVYFVSFPIVAYLFLPPIYGLKITSLYEYLEKRFSFQSRLIASLLFLLQTVFYMAVALYAPALALSSCFSVPLIVSIILTAFLSATYLLLGGARAGIYTSALQMLLILGSLFTIICVSLINWTPYEIFERTRNGGRLIFFDFRPNPTIRHAFWPLFFGGCTTIFSLFAANQLTIQRYMSLPTLQQAQRVVLLNVPMNSIILLMYIVIGLIIFATFYECHPALKVKDQIFPTYVNDSLFFIPGLEGVFLASIYSAGLSTLTASYSALTAVTIEDVIKVIIPRLFKHQERLSDRAKYKMVQVFPFVFATMAALFASVLQFLDTMILQISFSIFGAAGGASLGIFMVGLFCPWIKSKTAALAGQVSAIVGTVSIVAGSAYYHVRAVDLPLNCSDEYYYDLNTIRVPMNFTTSLIGNVTTDNSNSVFAKIASISYHYYGLIGVSLCFFVSHVVQFVLNVTTKDMEKRIIDPQLLSPWVRHFVTTLKPAINPSDIPLLFENIELESPEKTNEKTA